LSNSLKVLAPQSVLAAGKSVKVPVHIVNANSLAPGGHYAAVIYGVKSANAQSNKTVSVREAVSCLVFVKTYSGGTQKLHVTAFPVSAFTTSLPSNVNVVLANTGNTQAVPRGYAQIIGPGNTIESQGIMNIDSSMILPNSKRLFPITMSSHGNRSI